MKAKSEGSAVRFVQPKGKLDSKPSIPLCWLSSEPATAPMAAAAAIVTGAVWRWTNGERRRGESMPSLRSGYDQDGGEAA